MTSVITIRSQPALASRPPPPLPPHTPSAHLRAASISHPSPPTPAQNHRWSTPPHMFAPQPVPTYHQPPPIPISPPPLQRSPANFISPAPNPTYPYQPPPPPQHWSPAAPPVAPVPPSSIPPPNILDAQDDDTASPGPTPAQQVTHAPPRPPNPELLHLHNTLHSKLTSSLSALSTSLQSDTARLQQTQRELLAGAPAVQDEMARLEAVRDVCRAVAGRMRPAVQAAEANVAELRRKGDVEVDELVCSTTIVYNQCVSCL